MLLCDKCINAKDVDQAPVKHAGIQKKVKAYLEALEENASVEVIDGVLVVVPDSKKDKVIAYKHYKDNVSPQVKMSPHHIDDDYDTEDSLWVDMSSSSSSFKQEAPMHTKRKNDFGEASTSASKSFAAMRTGGVLKKLKTETTNKKPSHKLNVLVAPEDRKFILENIEGTNTNPPNKTCKLCDFHCTSHAEIHSHVLSVHLNKSPYEFNWLHMKKKFADLCKAANGSYQCLICKAEGSIQLFGNRGGILGHVNAEHPKLSVRTFLEDYMA